MWTSHFIWRIRSCPWLVCHALHFLWWVCVLYIIARLCTYTCDRTAWKHATEWQHYVCTHARTRIHAQRHPCTYAPTHTRTHVHIHTYSESGKVELMASSTTKNCACYSYFDAYNVTNHTKFTYAHRIRQRVPFSSHLSQKKTSTQPCPSTTISPGRVCQYYDSVPGRGTSAVLLHSSSQRRGEPFPRGKRREKIIS